MNGYAAARVASYIDKQFFKRAHSNPWNIIEFLQAIDGPRVDNSLRRSTVEPNILIQLLLRSCVYELKNIICIANNVPAVSLTGWSQKLLICCHVPVFSRAVHFDGATKK